MGLDINFQEFCRRSSGGFLGLRLRFPWSLLGIGLVFTGSFLKISLDPSGLLRGTIVDFFWVFSGVFVKTISMAFRESIGRSFGCILWISELFCEPSVGFPGIVVLLALIGFFFAALRSIS